MFGLKAKREKKEFRRLMASYYEDEIDRIDALVAGRKYDPLDRWRKKYRA